MSNTQSPREISGPFQVSFQKKSNPIETLGEHRRGKVFSIRKDGKYHFPRKKTKCIMSNSGIQIEVGDSVVSFFSNNTALAVHQNGKKIW